MTSETQTAEKKSMKGEIVYFLKPGEENTEEVFHIVKQRAKELGVKTIIIASTRGEVALKAADFFEGIRTIFVSHSTGWREPNLQEFTPEKRAKIESKGGIVLTATDAFMGVSGAIRKKFNQRAPTDFIASALRVLGEGTKVVCEIAMMAADAGLVRTDEDVICVAGTGKGADTAVVLRPVNSRDFFDLRIKEILCKPRF